MPGEWPVDLLSPADPAALYDAALPFLDWWLDYECWLRGSQPAAYRQGCFRHFKSVPKARAWLPPDTAIRWLEQFRKDPARTLRAKKM